MENLRKRSTNFIQSEMILLTELVAKHRTIIENKKTDAVTNKDKEAVWIKITTLFNAATSHSARSTKTLKLKYESMKEESKKTMAKHRQELYRTGGGPSLEPKFTNVEEKIMAICSNITGLDARNDSDSIPEPKPILINDDLPLETSLSNSVIVACNDIPITIEQDDVYPLCVLKDNNELNAGEKEQDDVYPHCALKDNTELKVAEKDRDAYDTNEQTEDNLEVKESEKENTWCCWTPKALKTKISSGLLPPKKVTKAGVTAKLDKLSQARLELVELQKEIAVKEHEFHKERHKLKMEHLQNDEIRRQEIHDILVHQLKTGVYKQCNIMDSYK